MLNFLNRRHRSTNLCFCTLAIHPPYRERAKALLADVAHIPWIVFTDEPDDFRGSMVTAIHHAPAGPMAIDFLTTLPPTGAGQGRPAYHDKRFVLQAALQEFDTAIFVDADSRIRSVPKLPRFRPGIAVVRDLHANIAEHLSRYGSKRKPAFEKLGLRLFGDTSVLNSARWCAEALFAVTKDGRESKFFEAWAVGAELLHEQGVLTGEGGVIGLAAEYAGWKVDYKALRKLSAATEHEGHGPKCS